MQAALAAARRDEDDDGLWGYEDDDLGARGGFGRSEDRIVARGADILYEISTAELMNRLVLERKLLLGCPLFVCYLLFVAFQMWALIISGGPSSKGEVHAALSENLNLESVADVKSAAELWNFVIGFSEATKVMHPMSDQYTSDPEQIFLVSGPREFSQEVVYPASAHPTIRTSFTFSVWVDRYDAPVIQKVIQKSSGEIATCWKWSVSSFQYGDHDRPADLPTQSVKARFGKHDFSNGQLSLATLVVNSDAANATASFYLNGEASGSANLQSLGFARPVTDCTGGYMTLGGTEKEFVMSDLKFFPRALTRIEIHEIFYKGQTLREIVTASRVQPVQLSVQESLQHVIESNVDRVTRQTELTSKVLDSLIAIDAQTVPPPVQSQSGSDIVLAGEVRWLDGVWDARANGTLDVIGGGAIDFTKSVTVSLWILQERDNKGVAVSLSGVNPHCFDVYCRGISNELKFDIDGMRFEVQLGTDTELSSVNFDNEVWRHVAISVTVQSEGPGAYRDADLLSGTVYMDGEETFDPPSILVRAAAPGNCSQGNIQIGARGDGAYEFAGSIRDVRMYPRALSAAEVKNLSEVHRACSFQRELADDMRYTSAYGHGCEWYFSMKKSTGTDVCNIDVYSKCPIACGKVPLCYDPIRSSVQIYSRVQRFDPILDNLVFYMDLGNTMFDEDLNFGEMCVDRRLSVSAWVHECTSSNVTEFDFGSWRADKQRFGSKPDLPAPVTCSVSECSWDPFEDASMIASDGSFTVYWWSLGGGHLTALSSPGERCFQQYGKYMRFRIDPENTAGYFTSTTDPEYERWAMKAVSSGPSGVTFCVDGECHTQPTPIYCQGGIHGLLMGAVTVSPVTVVPIQKSAGDLQNLFYSQRDHYDESIGPKFTDTQMKERPEITIEPFPLKTFLAVTPMIVQTRKEETTCPDFINENSEKMFSEQAMGKCEASYTCVTPEAWIPCWGDSDADFEIWESWALRRTEFHGRWVYPEFLYTLDNAVLVRNGRQIRNTDFINSGTTTVELVTVFSTPNLQMVSVLFVTADLEGNSVTAKVELKHMRSIEGDRLATYMGVSALAMFFGIVMMALEFRDVCTRIVRAFREGSSWCSAKDLVDAAQVFFSSGQVIFIGFRMLVASRSKSSREGVEGPLYSMPWADPIGVWDKLSHLFTILNELVDVMDRWETYDLLAFFILCILFMRMPLYQLLHTRLAAFPMTLAIMFEELLQFLIPSVSMFVFLAGLAHWSFGPTQVSFSTMPKSMETQLKMLTGSFPFEEGNWSAAEFIYFFLFIACFFFILVNFLLAIIVDSYEAYKRMVESQTQEFDFLADAALCLWQHGLKAPWCGWPRLRPLIRDLDARLIQGNEKAILTKGDFLDLPSVARCKAGAGATFWAYYTRTYDFSVRRRQASQASPTSPSAAALENGSCAS